MYISSDALRGLGSWTNLRDPFPVPWEGPKSGTCNSGFYYSYGVDYRLNPPRNLLFLVNLCQHVGYAGPMNVDLSPQGLNGA